MKTVMKRILFFAVIGCIAQTAFAQGAEVCYGSVYTIADAVPASAGEYRWVENGNVLSGTNRATYSVPSDKPVGIYTYIRQSKSQDCPEWQSSNEFTVTVFDCQFSAGVTTAATATFTDPRDGKKYKTIVMPDGKTWFAQNLNYTKDLTYNAYASEANGKQFTVAGSGVPAIGSYWCPPQYWVSGAAIVPVVSGDETACNTYGALYTWETAMMVDGKYSDEAKSGSAWEESWVSGNYFGSGAPGVTANADKNNARGEIKSKSGGRGICPMSWHVPTDLEWAQLLDKVEGDGKGSTYTSSQTYTGWWGTDAGQKMKSAGTYTTIGSDPADGSWLDHANRGTNESGFGAVPAGFRSNNGAQFYERGISAVYWSSSVGSSSGAWYRQFYYNDAQAYRYLYNRSYGFSVRCVRD
jgi:uncharacterized protein (TIGR02145 family)